ncbi:MAG: hypothetical protein J6K48_03200 [Lachnospiraceae bacterium]|nr:hypothetical protein [Lachnospiraceae bacterium]
MERRCRIRCVADMFLDKKEESKLHNGSVLVGYDLGEQYSQISYCIYGQGDVEMVATVVGTRQYNIPTILCKRKGANQWYYGKDAVNHREEEDMFPVEGLIALAKKGETVELDGETYDPVALLTLFIKRSMTLLSLIASIENIDGIMFTVDELDDRMVEVLAQAAANLNLKTSRIYFQSHTESFYFFVLHQPPELWNYQVIACEHNGMRLKTYRMECNKRTTPVVVLIEEQIYETLVLPEESEEETIREDAYRLADERFLGILQKMCEGRIVSSAYLLGDGFRAGWDERSLQFLCRNRRVFRGNNLFSRGACYGLLEKLDPGEVGQKHVFLGKDKLKSNIGMNVLRQGRESYFALLDAGENWYEVQKECEFLLGNEKEIAFVITPLDGKNRVIKEIPLKNAGVSGVSYTRYRMEVSMCAPDTVQIKVTDLGFGEFFPASGQVWEERFQV